MKHEMRRKNTSNPFSRFNIFSLRLLHKMKRERRLKRKSIQNKIQPPEINAMADCIFPQDLIVCILTRLPVKSIVRFKSVCKTWLFLLSTPSFKKLHQGQFWSDPENESFIIHRNSGNTLSHFKIGPNENKPMILDRPFSRTQIDIDFVGCCNGLVCFSTPPHSNVIRLWNPALQLFKRFSPLDECELHERVSLGFGYDDVWDDFRVVKMVCTESHLPSVGMYVNRVEVYSVNLDSWINIEVDFTFTVSRTKCDLIVNGNPYWFSSVYSPATIPMFSRVLLCFDVTKLVFKVVPLSDLLARCGDEKAHIGFIDYNDCLGAMVFTKDSEDVVEYLNVWVFDDSEQDWRTIRTCGRIEVNVDHIWHWTKNGKIIGERTDGQLFLFDPETRRVEELFYGGLHDQRVVLQRYTENLTYIEGMKPVKARTRRRKTIDDASA